MPSERNARLHEIVTQAPGIQVVSSQEAHDEALFAKAVELDIEGIVAKRMDAPYALGRQLAWFKIKTRLLAPGGACIPVPVKPDELTKARARVEHPGVTSKRE